MNHPENYIGTIFISEFLTLKRILRFPDEKDAGQSINSHVPSYLLGLSLPVTASHAALLNFHMNQWVPYIYFQVVDHHMDNFNNLRSISPRIGQDGQESVTITMTSWPPFWHAPSNWCCLQEHLTRAQRPQFAPFSYASLFGSYQWWHFNLVWQQNFSKSIWFTPFTEFLGSAAKNCIVGRPRFE